MTRQPAPELIRRALLRHGFDDVSDATLLVRYTRHADSAAFAELVRRYAPLVWGACRRACSDGHLAEDAFQSTFVALARQANKLRRPECMPGWLHGVARRTAWKLQARASRHSAVSLEDQPAIAPSSIDRASGRELIEAVESEIARLPAKYRSALLACWFEDDSLDEVARQLGISKGTLWGRLKRGRERLRRRLSTRGFGLPAIAATVAITGGSAPAKLADRAVETALRRAAQPATLAIGGAAWIKVAGLISVTAAIVVGVSTFFSAKPPETPKDLAKSDNKEIETRIDDGFPLPPSAIHRFGNRQMRHPDGIIASAVSPDGKLFATASYSAVVVWDLQTLSAKRTFADAHFNNYGTGSRGGRLGFLPDSSAIVISARPPESYGPVRSPTELLQVWDIESGKKRFAVSGGWHYEPSVWLTSGGKEIGLLSNVGNEAEVHFVDVKQGKAVRTVKYLHMFSSPWIAPGGEFMAYEGDKENGVGVAEVQTGKEIYSISGIKIHQAAVSRDGKLLVFVDEDGKVHAHDIPGKKELFTFNHPEKQHLGPMVISDDRLTLYFTSNHGRLFRWDLKANKKGADFAGRHGFWNLSGIVLSPDETMLYSTSLDHQIRRCNLKTGKELPLPDGYRTQTSVLPTVDSKHVVVADHAGLVDFWDLRTGRRTKQLKGAESGGVNCLAQSPDGRWLACGRTSQDIRLFDLSTDTVARDIHLEKPEPVWGDHLVRVAFAPDNKTLYSSTAKTGVIAWELSSGKRLWNVSGSLQFMACDPTGNLIAAGGGYGEPPVRWTLIDAKTGKQLATPEIEIDERNDVKNERTQRIPPYLIDLLFVPDGSRLLTVHYDGTLRIWDVQTQREVRRFKVDEIGRAGSLDIAPDGQWFAIGSHDGSITLYELATGAKIRSLAGHQAWVKQVAFTRDGRGLVSSAELSPVLWDLAPKDLPAVDGLPYLLWEGLKSSEGDKAYKLQWALAKSPQVAVKLFEDNIKPGELTIDREKFDKWIAGLDSAQFRAREVAEKELMSAGNRVPTGWLRQALADSKSDESRARLGRVLTKREKEPDPDAWRITRAIKVLELANTDDAKAQLKKWAGDAKENPVAIQAAAALGRLEK